MEKAATDFRHVYASWNRAFTQVETARAVVEQILVAEFQLQAIRGTDTVTRHSKTSRCPTPGDRRNLAVWPFSGTSQRSTRGNHVFTPHRLNDVRLPHSLAGLLLTPFRVLETGSSPKRPTPRLRDRHSKGASDSVSRCAVWVLESRRLKPERLFFMSRKLSSICIRWR